MKKLSFPALVLMITYFGFSPLEASPWKELQSKFKTVDSFSVNFRQEIMEEENSESSEEKIKIFEKPPPARGQIYIQRKPEFRLRWLYEFPSPREISFDGKSWSMKEDGRVEPIDLSEDQLKLSESFAFLWGESHPAITVESVDQNRFRLTPKSPQQAGFQEILVRVDKSLVKEAEILDLLDGKVRYEFSDWKL